MIRPRVVQRHCDSRQSTYRFWYGSNPSLPVNSGLVGARNPVVADGRWRLAVVSALEAATTDFPGSTRLHPRNPSPQPLTRRGVGEWCNAHATSRSAARSGADKRGSQPLLCRAL